MTVDGIVIQFSLEDPHVDHDGVLCFFNSTLDDLDPFCFMPDVGGRLYTHMHARRAIERVCDRFKLMFGCFVRNANPFWQSISKQW